MFIGSLSFSLNQACCDIYFMYRRLSEIRADLLKPSFCRQ